MVRILWYSCYLFSPLFCCFLYSLSVNYCSSSWPYLYSFCWSVSCQFSTFFSSVFCFLSFFIIIIMLSFLCMCLCQFIWLFHYISTFYCISFPFVLFCCSNFSLFSLLFLYIATIFSSPFHFHPTDYAYYFLLCIPLYALWCLLFCRGDMLCLINFFCSCILCSTYVIWFLWLFYGITFTVFDILFSFSPVIL